MVRYSMVIVSHLNTFQERREVHGNNTLSATPPANESSTPARGNSRSPSEETYTPTQHHATTAGQRDQASTTKRALSPSIDSHRQRHRIAQPNRKGLHKPKRQQPRTRATNDPRPTSRRREAAMGDPETVIKMDTPQTEKWPHSAIQRHNNQQKNREPRQHWEDSTPNSEGTTETAHNLGTKKDGKQKKKNEYLGKKEHLEERTTKSGNKRREKQIKKKKERRRKKKKKKEKTNEKKKQKTANAQKKR